MNNIILFIMIQSICACVIGWIGIAAVLIAGEVTGLAIGLCILGGFVAAFPVAWVIQKRMTGESAP